MEKHSGKIFYNILIVFCVLLFLVSAFMLGRYIVDSRKQQSQFDQLAQLVQKPAKPAPQKPQASKDPDTTVPDATEDPYPDCIYVEHPETGEQIPVLPQYAELFLQNPDTVGWMRLDDTKLNYPVMQTPDRKDFYLRRDFQKDHSSHGCLFVRGACDVFRPSDNLTIYGHNMRDGSMFAVLHRYESKEFWQDHPIIAFDTLREQNEYEVFAVFKTSATENKGFPYHLFVDAQNQQKFDAYVKSCKSLSFYDTEITPQYGDKLITLSTCDYSLENGRLVVVARMLPEFPQE